MPSAASTSTWYPGSITINVVVWNWRPTKIEVSNSLLHAKFEENKLPLWFYVTDTRDFNMTDKVTFQQSYIKTSITFLQFSTSPCGFLSCTVDKNTMWIPRWIHVHNEIAAYRETRYQHLYVWELKQKVGETERRNIMDVTSLLKP